MRQLMTRQLTVRQLPIQKLLLVLIFSITVFDAYANQGLQGLTQDMAYEDARAILISAGWRPIQNQQTAHMSLYAQDVYDSGWVEVVDCISMELDACRFRFSKQNKVLEIKTITRQLKLDSVDVIKK